MIDEYDWNDGLTPLTLTNHNLQSAIVLFFVKTISISSLLVLNSYFWFYFKL